jgi:hypothetical protein
MAFENCSKLIGVTIGSGITIIGDIAFYGCTNLTDIIIPDSVTRIGYGAFNRCSNLTNVTFAEKIGLGGFYIGNASFMGDLPNKYHGNGGGPGTYTTLNPGFNAVWNRQA